MIAIDTNLLIYAHRAATPEHRGARILGPGPGFADRQLQLAIDLAVAGGRVFDLQIALCAIDGGATELWTHDTRFIKVPGLRLRDPLTRS